MFELLRFGPNPTLLIPTNHRGGSIASLTTLTLNQLTEQLVLSFFQQNNGTHFKSQRDGRIHNRFGSWGHTLALDIT